MSIVGHGITQSKMDYSKKRDVVESEKGYL
jgi:hypothetical protein